MVNSITLRNIVTSITFNSSLYRYRKKRFQTNKKPLRSNVKLLEILHGKSFISQPRNVNHTKGKWATTELSSCANISLKRIKSYSSDKHESGNDEKRKNDAQKEKSASVEEKNLKNSDKQGEIKPKYGRLVTFPYQRVWSRCILILAVMFVVWYNSKNGKEVSLARQKDVLISRTLNVDCSPEYKAELDQFPGCVPEKCGRVVTDKLVSGSEVDTLLQLAKRGFKFGGSDGGASILDLQSGALSKGSKFIDIYSLKEAKKIFNSADFAIYKVVKTKIHHAIAHHFGVDANKIYLTKPTFFSKITNVPAKTLHDEYWHPHVDKETYESFHYTSLLYLGDYNRDFEGGRFIFIDKENVNATIEPRKGRVSMFTSGAENLHAVEIVTSGTRYALTVSFTCDKQFAISDPSVEKTKNA